MNHASARVLCTATGIGMTVLLAGCGSGGSGGGASVPLASTHAETTSATSAPATSKTTTSPVAPTTSSRHTGAPPATTKTSKPAQSAPTHQAGVPLCSVNQLRISLGDGNSDPQGTHWALRFSNVGNKTCKLTGAPGVSYVAGNDGHQVGKSATRIKGHQPIVLIPGATASAGLFTSSAPRKSACQQLDVRGLRIYPPDSYKSAYIAHPDVSCSGGPYLRVGPILPGPNNATV